MFNGVQNPLYLQQSNPYNTRPRHYTSIIISLRNVSVVHSSVIAFKYKYKKEKCALDEAQSVYVAWILHNELFYIIVIRSNNISDVYEIGG